MQNEFKQHLEPELEPDLLCNGSAALVLTLQN